MLPAFDRACHFGAASRRFPVPEEDINFGQLKIFCKHEIVQAWLYHNFSLLCVTIRKTPIHISGRALPAFFLSVRIVASFLEERTARYWTGLSRYSCCGRDLGVRTGLQWRWTPEAPV